MASVGSRWAYHVWRNPFFRWWELARLVGVAPNDELDRHALRVSVGVRAGVGA
jgi:hypothetical protein